MPWGGPVALAAAAANQIACPYSCFGSRCRCPGVAHWISSCCCRWLHLSPIVSLQVLPIILLGPNCFSGGASNAMRWAHYFWGGAITLAAAAADGVTWVQLFFGGFC